MKYNKLIALACGALILAGCASDNKSASVFFRHKAQEIPLSNEFTEKIIDNIYQRMSMDERAAQLQSMYLSELFDKNNQLDTIRCYELIPNGIGHFAQYASNSLDGPEELRDMVKQVQEWLVKNTPTGIPALFHEEVITGIAAKEATVYPQQIGLACSFNTDLAAEKTRQTAISMRKIGGMLSLSPMVDVIRNPYFNRLEESYGEDAYLSAAMGSAFVEGLQDGGMKSGVAACSKHFWGYGGGCNTDRRKELFEEILLPHETMIRTKGSKVIMTGYHYFHGVKAVANKYLMQDILRNYLGFDGITVSDYGSINQIDTEEDALHRGVAAINAGNDVEFQNRDNYQYLPEAIKQGLVSEATFEGAVKRVLRLKAAVGLFDKNPTFCAEGDIEFDTAEERQTAYELATQSVVLLKNDNILPIEHPRKIALVGPNANTMWAMLGDYTYQGLHYFWRGINTGNTNNQIITLKEGLEKKLPDGCTLNYSCGVDWVDKTETSISKGGDDRAIWLDKNRHIARDEKIDAKEALSLAANSDIIIAAMGENTLLCGENRDRGSLRLPGKQEEFVRQLIVTGKPVVLVMFGGRAQVIGDLADKCAAVIQAWYPGEEGGNALADIIYGNVAPSGKLSVSYPKVELNENICYNYSSTPDERIQYHFGYGLNYTTFDYSDLVVDKSVFTTDELFNISFNVTNTGSREGDEIVQIYISPTSASQPLKPIKLAGFGRVSLKPGETKKIDFIMSPQQLGYYNDGIWAIEKGDFIIKVGAASNDIRLTDSICLIGDAHTMPLRTVYFSEMKTIDN